MSLSQKLSQWIDSRTRLTVLTGAGCSTESGIPDYRGPNGSQHRRAPMTITEFLRSPVNRQFYWARSYLGWSRFSAAQPNRTHAALASLQAMGRVAAMITQNVDGLHQKAGSTNVLDLHGRIDTVACLGCTQRTARGDLQERMALLNQSWNRGSAGLQLKQLPDGDSELDRQAAATFVTASCLECGGILKPDVVFFGESVARPLVEQAMSEVERGDGLLVVGSSLTVWSGYRFVLAASRLGIPITIVNLGATRGDAQAWMKIDAECGELLSTIAVERVSFGS